MALHGQKVKGYEQFIWHPQKVEGYGAQSILHNSPPPPQHACAAGVKRLSVLSV